MAVAEQNDHRIVAAGNWYVQADERSYGSLMRYSEQGDPDPSFGASGMALWTIGNCRAVHNEIHRYPTGRITVVGALNNALDTNMVYIARYLNESDVSAHDLDGIDHAGPKVHPDPVIGDRITLVYTLVAPDRVRKHLFDAEGRSVAQLGNAEMRAAGRQEQVVDLPGDLAPGIYSIQLETSSRVQLLRFIKLGD